MRVRYCSVLTFINSFNDEMEEKITMRLCVVQFERAGAFKKNVEKAQTYLERADHPDFALLGGEFSLNESKKVDPAPRSLNWQRRITAT